LEKNISRKKN